MVENENSFFAIRIGGHDGDEGNNGWELVQSDGGVVTVLHKGTTDTGTWQSTLPYILVVESAGNDRLRFALRAAQQARQALYPANPSCSKESRWHGCQSRQL